jgi:ferrous iron transport protein A
VVYTLKNTNKKQWSLTGKFSGDISHFNNERMACKLMAMGVLPGSHIELLRRAPFGGGWYVKVDDLRIALRQQEIDSIELR